MSERLHRGRRRRARLTKLSDDGVCLAGCDEWNPCPNEWDRDPPAPRGYHSPVSALTCAECGSVDFTSEMHISKGGHHFLCEECV